MTRSKHFAFLTMLALGACSNDRASSSEENVKPAVVVDKPIATADEPNDVAPEVDTSGKAVRARLLVERGEPERLDSDQRFACTHTRDHFTHSYVLRLVLGEVDGPRSLFISLPNVETGQKAFEVKGGLNGEAPGKLSTIFFVDRQGLAYKNVSTGEDGTRETRCRFEFEWGASGKLMGRFNCRDVAKFRRDGRDTKLVDQVKMSGSFVCEAPASVEGESP